MEASGEQYVLKAGGYEAVVTEVGGTVRRLRHDGRDLLAGFTSDQVRPVYRGALLVPWPNRIADGRYRFDGRPYTAPLNEADRRNAIHGLLAWSAWALVDHAPDRVVLHCRLHPQPAYPARLDVTVTYAVGPEGLTTALEATNGGPRRAPYGCAPHPYLVAGAGRVDDWTFQLAAEQVLQVTPDRLLPVGLAAVAGTAYDFRTPVQIGDRELDNALTGLPTDGSGPARARLWGPDGRGVQVSWDPGVLPWVQVHTADRPEPELDRAGLAVEPMTCPPDAFNSGTDVVVLEPGERHRAEWRIAAL